MTVEAGSPAPDFRMDTPDGPVSLADYRGRKLVLYFYPKDDTSGCTSEAQQFTALVNDFKAADTEILGVSKDSLARHEKFIAKYELKIPLASDPEGQVIQAYGSWVEKSMYGRKYMGIDRSTFLIDREGKIAKSWRKVKVTNHAATVLKEAQALD